MCVVCGVTTTMSVAPPTAGAAKALFTSPQPTITTTAEVPRPPPVPSPSSVNATTGNAVAVLSPQCAAKVSAVITDDLRQLSRDDLDVKRWLNATLSRVLEAAKETGTAPATAAAATGDAKTANSGSSTAAAAKSTVRKSLQLEEQLVQLLHARVQAHSQELSAGIEDLISSTLVRLPRTTMELSRMSAEAEELTEQLQSIETIVQPAVKARSDAYVVQLHTRKASETKLRTCTQLLEKAARVEESIRNIQYLVEHREAAAAASNSRNQKNSESNAAASPPAGADSAEKRGGGEAAGRSSATRQQRDLDEVAAIIRQARDDLKEITAVDDTFGEQHKAQLEQFEHYIEHALEEECVACLRAHQLERATRLITTLHSIGRADAVLKRYGEQAAAHMVEQQETKLRAAVNSRGSNGDGNAATASNAGSAAAAVAELLRMEIIPDDSTFLSQELVFLSSLVRGASTAVVAAAATTTEGGATPASAATIAAAPTTGESSSHGDGGASSKPPRNAPVAKVGPAASAAAHNNSNSSSSGSNAADDDPRAAQVLEVLAVLLTKLHDPVQATLQPLLTERPDTTNKDFVACFTAIQQLKVSASAAAGPSTSSAKDPLEKLAREVTHRALALFVSLFQEEKVLERYAERVYAPVRVYCAQPLATILAPTVAASDDDSLARVLTQAVQEVLVYMPEKISARCTAAWRAELSKTLAQQLQPAPNTSQHVLLQHLYLYKERVKPLLAKTQLAVDDWLSSGAMHERYPTSAGLLRADLQSRLWAPLKAEVEDGQRATQRSILCGITRPILAKVDAYHLLPCWGNQAVVVAARGNGSGSSPAAQGSSSGRGGVAASTAKSLSLYTQDQVAPSSAVRDMGEMLMELPLTLETLASTAVAESYEGDKSSGGVPTTAVAVIPASDTDAEEGVRVMIDEHAEEWLETVVRDVVRAFLDNTVLQLQIGPFDETSSSREGQTSSPSTKVLSQLYAMAVEQLTTDLDYLRNILSAVNEESQETVEQVMQAIRALPTHSQGAFVVGEAIAMKTSVAGAEADALKTPTESALQQEASGSG